MKKSVLLRLMVNQGIAVLTTVWLLSSLVSLPATIVAVPLFFLCSIALFPFSLGLVRLRRRRLLLTRGTILPRFSIGSGTGLSPRSRSPRAEIVFHVPARIPAGETVRIATTVPLGKVPEEGMTVATLLLVDLSDRVIIFSGGRIYSVLVGEKGMDALLCRSA